MWYIIVGILAIILVMWVSHIIAQSVEAKRGGFGWIALAILLSLSLLLAIAFTGILTNPLLLILVGIFSSIVIFSLVLGTGPLNGFYISVVYNIIFGIVLVILLSIFFKVSLVDTFNGEQVSSQNTDTISKVQIAAENVCYCGENLGCLIRKNRDLVNLVYFSGYTFDEVDTAKCDAAIDRAKGCTFNPAPYNPIRAIVDISDQIVVDQLSEISQEQVDNEDMDESIPQEYDPSAVPDDKPLGVSIDESEKIVVKPMDEQVQIKYVESVDGRVRLKFRPINFYEADNYIGYATRVTRLDEKVFTGVIYRIQGTSVYIKRRIYGGSAIIPVSQREIDTIEIYD
jgi:hypothetical protein